MQVHYEGPKAKVTATSAIIQGQKFSLDDIQKISAHDEYKRAWKWKGFTIGKIALLLYHLRPTSGLYFLVTTMDGKVHEFSGLTTLEIRAISRAMAVAKENQIDISGNSA